MREPDKLAAFEQTILPHLDAAYNLARWLTRDERDAEDVVQEAYLRAFRFFDGFRGGNPRAWLLKIVRNTSYTWLRQNMRDPLASFDEDVDDLECQTCDPETLALASADHEALQRALAGLPVPFREVIILHELEGLSYKEIALIAGIPLGTVMSRLARARKHLQQQLTSRSHEEARVEV